MAKLYNLKILTPEREFFDGDIEEVVVTVPDGRIAFLAGHTPFTAPLEVGTISIKNGDGEWEEAVNSEGFMEVNRHGAMIFVQTCERPEEIDRRRAEEARIRAEEALRQRQSITEYKQMKLALARAMARLKITGGS
jgi:F-type H+-transporting ATPase subunit epsilon